MGRRKNIALFVAMIDNEFSYAICEGALLAAKEIDANLYILPAGIIDAAYDDVEANRFRYQYNTLYSCAQFKDIDAVVFEYGTTTTCMEQNKKVELLRQMGDAPIILLAGEEEGYSSVCIDNRSGLEDTIEYLITKKNCRKIGYISGPVETSLDAKERLDVYYYVMKKHGLDVTEDWIRYGNFTIFTEGLVTDLIKQHPDVDAIVFANDLMAAGGYKAIRRLGLQPGKDILVTGFDDTATSRLLEPSLTTVKVDAKELAYRAVLACADVMEGKEIHHFVKSKMIIRESTDEAAMSLLTQSELTFDDTMNEESIQQLSKMIYDKYFDIFFENSDTVRMRKVIENYVTYYLQLAKEDGTLLLEEDEFVKNYIEFSSIYTKGYVDLRQFFSIDYFLHEYLNRKLAGEQDRLALLQAKTFADQAFMNFVTKQNMAIAERNKGFEFVLTGITRGMLQFAKEDKKIYATVINKLQKMDFVSSYIYTYGIVIEHDEDTRWIPPEYMYVKAYHNGDEVYLYANEEKKIATDTIFSNEILPQDRRRDMLVLPMFSGKENYGFMVIESTLENFRYAAQMASQVSVSSEVLEIIKRQNTIKMELEKNLAKTVENNRVLDEMSRSDHLTGILNRRGFLDTVNDILNNRKHYGKKAIAVYADMDNLKIVNDEFGHEEGDYSLKIIAKALQESFRQSDVVARMGGDEFAAFAIVNQENFPAIIKQRIHSVLDGLNDNNKMYRIDMSIGTAEFIISEDIDIQRILNEADTNLYVEKRNKKKRIYKD